MKHFLIGTSDSKAKHITDFEEAPRNIAVEFSASKYTLANWERVKGLNW